MRKLVMTVWLWFSYDRGFLLDVCTASIYFLLLLIALYSFRLRGQMKQSMSKYAYEISLILMDGLHIDIINE